MKRRASLKPGETSKANYRQFGSAIKRTKQLPQTEWKRRKNYQEMLWRQRAWEETKEANTPAMHQWQQRVMQRYGNRCVVCHNDAHTGHHAYTQAAHPTWKFKPWVGVPVCWLCHQHVHSQPDLLIAMQLVANQQLKADKGKRGQVTLREVAEIIHRVRGVFQDHKGGSQRVRDILFANEDMPALHDAEGGW